MGKKENIKRLKKLRDEKRKRELDLMGITPDLNKAITDLAREQGLGITIRQNTGPVKYSELLNEFIAPMLQSAEDMVEVKKAIQFGIVVWNCAVFKKYHDPEYDKAFKIIQDQFEDDQELYDMFYYLMDRKKDFFDDHDVIIMNFFLRETKGKKLHLDVSSVIYNPRV